VAAARAQRALSLFGESAFNADVLERLSGRWRDFAVMNGWFRVTVEGPEQGHVPSGWWIQAVSIIYVEPEGVAYIANIEGHSLPDEGELDILHPHLEYVLLTGLAKRFDREGLTPGLHLITATNNLRYLGPVDALSP